MSKRYLSYEKSVHMAKLMCKCRTVQFYELDRIDGLDSLVCGTTPYLNVTPASALCLSCQRPSFGLHTVQALIWCINAAVADRRRNVPITPSSCR